MIHFELVTLAGTKFSQEVYEVLLPTPDGQIAVLPHHIPLVSMAVPGIIAIRHKLGDSDSKLEYYATNGGVIEILDNVVRVLADEADHENAINEQEAQKAFERAQEALKLAKSPVELSDAQSLMDRHAVRLRVADLRRRKRR